jgi:hypothetical protein
MKRRFQFSARNMLIATTLAAVWCAVLVSEKLIGTSDALEFLWAVAVLTLPASAAGTLAGRPVLGTICGLCSSFGWIVVIWWATSIS